MKFSPSLPSFRARMLKKYKETVKDPGKETCFMMSCLAFQIFTSSHPFLLGLETGDMKKYEGNMKKDEGNMWKI